MTRPQLLTDAEAVDAVRQTISLQDYVEPRKKVMPIKVPEKLPRCWTADDVKLLLISASRLKGQYRDGQQKSLYWRSYVLAVWDSGLRGCDMRRIPRAAICDDGWAMIVQHKTGKLMRLLFRAETVRAIHDTFPPDRELIWPAWSRLEAWRGEARRLVLGAGLKGSIGQLGRSSGTDEEMDNPGRGHEYAGGV